MKKVILSLALIAAFGTTMVSCRDTKKEEVEIKKYVTNCFGYQKKQQIAQKITGQIAAYIRENPQKAEETIELLEDVFQLSTEKLPQR